MKILAVDYGRRKIGLAIADGPLAEPYKVIQADTAIGALRDLIQKEGIEKIVVGVSEGQMGEESKVFSLNLSKILNIPVETFDETLTTQDAQKLAIEAHVKRKKRKALEDAFAASLMLQSYLDSYV